MKKEPTHPRFDSGGAPWLIVAAGLHFRGGMDKANAELASFLLYRGTPVHIVAHDVDRLFRQHPLATLHPVPKPAGSFALGEFGLDRAGRRLARALVARDPATRVVVNGGNCQWHDVNWVHYVHHAWTELDRAAPVWFKAKHRIFSARWRRTEKTALRSSRVAIANSELTRGHLLEHLGLAPDRVRTVYLGTDPHWGPPTADERRAAREWLGLDGNRPAVAFVGGLGLDRRKGFDVLWRAWTALCQTPDWDVHLVVAGSGADAHGLRTEVQHAELSHRVAILGHTERVKDVLAGVDLLVSPVRYEPYGLNVQEAICRGVPALVSRTAGVAERFPPPMADMLLDDAKSVAELVAALRRWRAQRADWTLRAAALGRELRAYTWRDMAVAFVDAVSEAPASDQAARALAERAS